MLNQDEKILKNSRNKVRISGKFTEEFKYAYTSDAGEYFFENKLEVKRKDGKVEHITIIASEYLLYDIEPVTEKYVVIDGNIKTAKIIVENEKSSNDVIVFAKQIDLCKEKINDENSVYLEGTIISKPIVKKGQCRIRIIFLAVEAGNNTIEDIPCKFCEEEAKRIRRFQVGTKLQLYGTIEGKKKLRLFENGSVEMVSIHSIKGIIFNKV